MNIPLQPSLLKAVLPPWSSTLNADRESEVSIVRLGVLTTQQSKLKLTMKVNSISSNIIPKAIIFKLKCC
jgi:hypothetical protein